MPCTKLFINDDFPTPVIPVTAMTISFPLYVYVSASGKMEGNPRSYQTSGMSLCLAPSFLFDLSSWNQLLGCPNSKSEPDADRQSQPANELSSIKGIWLNTCFPCNEDGLLRGASYPSGVAISTPREKKKLPAKFIREGELLPRSRTGTQKASLTGLAKYLVSARVNALGPGTLRLSAIRVVGDLAQSMPVPTSIAYLPRTTWVNKVFEIRIRQ